MKLPAALCHNTSIAETYNVESKTSCLTEATLPTLSETTVFDCYADESEIYRRVNNGNHHRKKKSSLYSETQSDAFVPEVQNFAAASVDTSPVTTEGDGTTNRRENIDTGVRIGHTSINYFLSWDTTDFVQQEHMYNSTGVGVQERGHDGSSSRRSVRLHKNYQKRRQESDDFEGKDIDLATASRSISSNANCIQSYEGFICGKESVIQEEFIDHDRSWIYESHSNECVDSFDNLSQSRSCEGNSSSNDLARYASVSKSSTVIYTLFSKDQSPTSISQSDVETNPDRSHSQNVTLIFSNSLETSRDDSCTGLLSNPYLDSSKNDFCERVETPPRPEMCASDETHIIKRKHHRLTEQARQYLQKYDEASTSSEECMSVDQFDVSNSSIVLRRKRKKSSGGLTFLGVRRTHPCRNLPRLLLKQDDKQPLCNASESSESQIIKEVSLEDVKDYSESCCKLTSSEMKRPKPKWVKSLDNLIDFAYIIPKITRLGNDEQIFLKKGSQISTKRSKSTTALAVNSEGEKRDAGVVTSHKSIAQEASFASRKGTQKRGLMSKPQVFRANRKRKYILVKVNTSSTFPSVVREASKCNGSQPARKDATMSSSEFEQHRRINGASPKRCAEVPGNESAIKNKHRVTKRGIRKVSAFLGCVTAKTSENKYNLTVNSAGMSTPCNQDSDETALSRVNAIEKEDGNNGRGSVAEGRDKVRTNRRKLEDNVVGNSAIGCTSEISKETSAERGLANNKPESVATKKEVEKKRKRKSVVIGGGNGTNDAVDGRRKTDRNIRKKAVVLEDDKSTNDCVQKVSFDEAYSSIRAKKNMAGVEHSDDGWVTDEAPSVLSEHDSTRSEQPVAARGTTNQVESVTQNVDQPESAKQVDIIKSKRPASFFKSVKKPAKHVVNRIAVPSPIPEEVKTRSTLSATRDDQHDAPKKPASARLRAAEYDRKNKLRMKAKREHSIIQMRESVRSTIENEASFERERCVATGQASLTAR